MLKLKSLTLNSRVIQSPMAGCTDLAFRLVARERGMEFAFLEMVSADALVRKNERTLDLLKSVESDKPLGAQLVGCNPDTMGEAAAMIEEMGFDLLDINCGCPVPKVTAPGGGSALLLEPEKTKAIFESVVKNIKRIPVTVKMRKGYEDASGEEAVKIAKIAEDAGLSAVTVHGRTRAQGYSGSADWNAIAKVKKALKIPVFGNGDVINAETAKRLIETSGCDGVMIGRGGLGNPWIYKQIEDALSNQSELSFPAGFSLNQHGEVRGLMKSSSFPHVRQNDGEIRPDGFRRALGRTLGGNPDPRQNHLGMTRDAFIPTLEDKKKAALQHLELELKYEAERPAVLKFRKIACWYLFAMPGAAELRHKVNAIDTAEGMRQAILNFGV